MKNRHTSLAYRCAFVLTLSIFGMGITGCGGSSEPTKIYEGGGTIPEIVDQPEPGEGKKEAPAKK